MDFHDQINVASRPNQRRTIRVAKIFGTQRQYQIVGAESPEEAIEQIKGRVRKWSRIEVTQTGTRRFKAKVE